MINFCASKIRKEKNYRDVNLCDDNNFCLRPYKIDFVICTKAVTSLLLVLILLTITSAVTIVVVFLGV